MALTAMRRSLLYTFHFVRDSLPEGAQRVLEIGCGSGELAALLVADGLKVIAIDSDPECVSMARSMGLDARRMVWPAALNQRFDAVLFTRSLHHVGDLPASIAAAAEALNAGGRIIVEDFRAEGGSDDSQRWFESLVRDLDAKRVLSSDASVEALLDKAAPSSGQDHHLHASADIRRELSALNMVLEEDAAYYFRYLEPHLTDQATGELLEHELAMIGAGAMDALGKRFVASIS